MRKINQDAFAAFMCGSNFKKQNREVEVRYDKDGNLVYRSLWLYGFKFLEQDNAKNGNSIIYRRADSYFSFSGSHTTSEFKNDINKCLEQTRCHVQDYEIN